MVTEVRTVTNIDDTEKYEIWKEKVNRVLKEAKEKPKKTKKTGNAMITRHLSKNPPSAYEIGEQVLIKLLISDKKIRGKKKPLILQRERLLIGILIVT